MHQQAQQGITPALSAGEDAELLEDIIL